jgi:tetratricopeptide (TPR) repeat protein
LLARQYRNLGVYTLDLLHNEAEAEEPLRNAIAEHRTLVDHYPREIQYRISLADAYNSLARALNRLEKNAEMYETFQQSRDILVETIKDYPDPWEARRKLAWTLANTAEARTDDGDQEIAIGLLDEAEAHMLELLPLGRPADVPGLATILQRKSFAQRGLGRLDEAVQTHLQVVRLRREILDEQPDNPAYLNSLGGDLQNLAQTQFERGEYSESVTLLEQAIQLQLQAREASPEHPRYRTYLALDHAALARCLARRLPVEDRDIPRARAHGDKAIEVDAENPAAWLGLGIVQYCSGEWKQAIESLNKANDLDSDGDSFPWFFFAMCHCQLGQDQEAREWYERAVSWMAEHQPERAILKRLREEAAKLLETENEPEE